ncbi:MAG: prepilin peptidase [Minisyncoccia bacterium]
MPLLTLTLLFILGAIIASFVGVVVARIHTGTSFLTGRSRCDACDATLPPLALVPILSWTASKGRAQCCGARISLLSPLTEALLGGLFMFTYIAVGLSTALPFMLLSLSLLLALVLYDFSHQILPPALLYTFVGVSALAGFLAYPSDFSSTLLSATLIGGSLAVLHFLSRGRAMGLADAPLAFGLSLLVGPAALSGFIFSFWIGAVIGIVLLLQRPVGSRMGVEVPFAPFLAAGFLLAYFTQWNPFTFIAAFL